MYLAKILADAWQKMQDSVSYLIFLIILFLTSSSTFILSPHFLFFIDAKFFEVFLSP
ncbi:uncharacterized protein METZ01_LOCUS156694 [marine metagenome]|uniref:Uncharacterized protein n=1 Tax=marine metagenome TaxID=408172 RepID=A0A382AQJ3_9ZZZZ